MITYSYFLDKPNSSTETSIMFNAVCNNKRCKFSIGEKVATKDWSKEAMRCIDKSSSINFVLSRIDLKMAEINKDISLGRHINTVQLKAAILEVNSKTVRVEKKKFGFFEMWNEIYNDRKSGREKHDGMVFADNSTRSYLTTRGVIETYAEATGADMDMQSFDIKKYEAFSSYLTDLPNYGKNSIAVHIKNLKTFIGAAFAREWHTNLIFRDPRFKIITEKPENIAVSMEVLQAMDAMKLQGYEAKARDWFLVEAFTGLRVSDSISLKMENIVESTITKISKKTNTKTVVPISTILRNVLHRNGGAWPKHIFEKDVNHHIKSVAKKTGMLNKRVLFTETRQGKPVHNYFPEWECVTSHTAKRSFITNLRLSGVAISDIATLAGVTEETIKTYDKVTPNQVAEKVANNSFFK